MSRFIKVTELTKLKEGVVETAPAYVNVDNIYYIKESTRHSYRKDGSVVSVNITEIWTSISYIAATEDMQSIINLIHNQNRR
jgi:hypothetical protein